jgi:hypothetical protein
MASCLSWGETATGGGGAGNVAHMETGILRHRAAQRYGRTLAANGWTCGSVRGSAVNPTFTGQVVITGPSL